MNARQDAVILMGQLRSFLVSFSFLCFVLLDAMFAFPKISTIEVYR